MTAGWAAGSVRARGLARRRIGAGAARRLAGSRTLADALGLLTGTGYGPGLRSAVALAGQPGADQRAVLAGAQHAVAATVLWDLRVLAGWLPPGGAQLIRVLAGWFEIANVDAHLARLAGRPAPDDFTLGALATAWPAVRRAATTAEVRAALARSAWRDPGGGSDSEIRVGLRARWAVRVADIGGPAADWAASALAVLLAGERFGPGDGGQADGGRADGGRADGGPGDGGRGGQGGGRRDVSPVLHLAAARLLGSRAARAGSLAEPADLLPGRIRWVLAPVPAPADLWRAEAAWWERTAAAARRMLATGGLDRAPVLGASVVLAADAREVAVALEVAARGGRPEVLDAVA